MRWYRDIGLVPEGPDARATTSCSPSCCTTTSRFADAAVEYEKAAYDYPTHAKSADAGYTALLGYAAASRSAPRPTELPALQRASVASALRFANAFPADPRTGPVLTQAAEKLFALKDVERPPRWRSRCSRSIRRPRPRSAAWPGRWSPTPPSRRAPSTVPRRATREVLALTPEQGRRAQRSGRAPGRVDLQAGRAGPRRRQPRDAVGHFTRVAAVGAAVERARQRSTTPRRR